MNGFFRRLPLPGKMILIGLVPLLFLVFMSFQIYHEKTQKVNQLGSFIQRIQQTGNTNTLIDYLQNERKYTFDFAMTKSRPAELDVQRPATDSIINYLQQNPDPSMESFANYTFLDKLQQVRNQADSGKIGPNEVMHYYSTMIYRLNTLNTVSHGSVVYLQPVYMDLVAQKLISEMITSLGIMRSNVYNVLYTREYMVETLIGMVGLHDVYMTYEKEFYIKASPETITSYNNLRNNSSLKQVVDYMDTLFKRFSFDDSYTAQRWWTVSDKGIDLLNNLQKAIGQNVNEKTNAILKEEKMARERTLIFLIVSLLFVIIFVSYAIRVITKMLNELKIAAQEISIGARTQVPVETISDDVIGNLAQSISRINENNLRLVRAATAIGKGDFNTPVQLRSKDDLLGNAILRMRDNLQQLNYALQQKVVESGQMNEELRNLSAHLQNIREDERIHIAREMHDELGQLLTGFTMDISWLKRRLATDDAEIGEKLDDMKKLIEEAVIFVRTLAAELRPSILDDFGLIPALEWHSEEFKKRFKIDVNFHSQVEELKTSPLIATGLFRMYQESLTNVARHAEAHNVIARLDITSDQICFSVSDDGKGFDMSNDGKRKTLGLLGMKERAAMMGGKLEINSELGTGTAVMITIPFLNNNN